jgi:hypothetical protein
MLTRIIVPGAGWIGIALAVWLTLVPASISVTTFAWLNAALAVVFLVVVGSTLSARPTTSIAQVLYDVEHPSDAQ